MTDGDPLKTGIGAAAEALMKPLTDLVEKIAGPAAEELGLTFQDHVRAFRFKRQIRLLQKVKEYIAETKQEPQRVPLKVLAPIFESATLEEDDWLQDRWAALLANGATSDGVRVSYAEVLKQLTRHEMTLLRKVFFEVFPSRYASISPARMRTLIEEWDVLNFPELDPLGTFPHSVSRIVENLVRLGLFSDREGSLAEYQLWRFQISEFGYDFVSACESPHTLRQALQKAAKTNADLRT